MPAWPRSAPAWRQQKFVVQLLGEEISSGSSRLSSIVAALSKRLMMRILEKNHAKTKVMEDTVLF
jgi:hypothetical protein